MGRVQRNKSGGKIMGIYCWAEVFIDLEDKKDIKEILSFLNTELEPEDASTEEEIGSSIKFKITGNHSVDFSILDELKEYAKKEKIVLKISASEWVEGEGYYYDSNGEED